MHFRATEGPISLLNRIPAATVFQNFPEKIRAAQTALSRAYALGSFSPNNQFRQKITWEKNETCNKKLNKAVGITSHQN